VISTYRQTDRQTDTHLTASVQDNLDKAAPEKSNQSSFQWDIRWWSGSCIGQTMCQSFAPRSRQITITHFFTGQMLFLLLKQVSKCWRQKIYNNMIALISHFIGTACHWLWAMHSLLQRWLVFSVILTFLTVIARAHIPRMHIQFLFHRPSFIELLEGGPVLPKENGQVPHRQSFGGNWSRFYRLDTHAVHVIHPTVSKHWVELLLGKIMHFLYPFLIHQLMLDWCNAGCWWMWCWLSDASSFQNVDSSVITCQWCASAAAAAGACWLPHDTAGVQFS